MNDDMKREVLPRETRRAELAEIDFTHGAQGGALMRPSNGRELMDMANLMSQSGSMIRDFYRRNPGDCMALIMICAPYGLNPFQVSWKTYRAPAKDSSAEDAPIAFEAQVVAAMVNVSAPVKGRLRYSYHGEGDNLVCTVTGIERETGEALDYTSPKLGQIAVKRSPLWRSDPRQQLGYYSARAWARRHFPELLLGVYTREEIEDAEPMRDITPREGTFADRATRAREAVALPDPEVEQSSEDVPPEAVEESQDGESQDDELQDGLFDAPAEDGLADAFREGGEAAREGIAKSDCPYPKGSDARVEWLAGFRRAEAEA